MTLFIEFPAPIERCPNCRWTGTREELRSGEEIEQYHALNRGRHIRESLHRTKYEECPKCGRWIYADNVPLARRG